MTPESCAKLILLPVQLAYGTPHEKTKEFIEMASAQIQAYGLQQRREALEEAAKIAEGRKFYDPEGWLAQAIRSLNENGVNIPPQGKL